MADLKVRRRLKSEGWRERKGRIQGMQRGEVRREDEGGREWEKRLDAGVVLCLYIQRLVSVKLNRAISSSHTEDITALDELHSKLTRESM